MAGNSNGGEELAAQLKITLKQGERLVEPTRRPDGTLRKPIIIRPGYNPPDEVPIYQPKGALLKKEMESQVVGMPPGYDPKPNKTKAAKRNERKKDKRLQQAAFDKDKDLDKNEVSSTEDVNEALGVIDSVVSQINELSVSANSSAVTPPSNSTNCFALEDHAPDIDKRIRTLKKKIRLTEAQLQKSEVKPEQLEKMAKLEDWRKELKLLEDKKAQQQA